MGKESCSAAKFFSFSTPERSSSSHSNFHVIIQYKSFICSSSHCCCINFSVTSGLRYTYIMLILINWLPNLNFSMKTALNGHYYSPHFNAVWEILFQLLLAFFFNPSLFITHFINFLLYHSSCDCIA